MELTATTVIPGIFFLIASFGFGWALLALFGKAVVVYAYSTRNEAFNFDFAPQVWTGAVCFAYIMGYLFIL